jgi:hypothetical protein
VTLARSETEQNGARVKSAHRPDGSTTSKVEADTVRHVHGHAARERARKQ